MSTILDALRRAQADRELERERDARARVGPGLFDAEPAQPPAGLATAHAGRWLRRALAALVLMGLLGVAWWLGRSAPRTAPAATPPAVAPVPTLPTVPAAAPVTPVATATPAAPVAAARSLPAPAPVSEEARQPVRPPAATLPPRPTSASLPSAPSSSPPSERIPSLAELSPAQRPPPLQVGGSMHSPDPQLRSLILNGQLFREGDEVAPGWVLERIEPRRAVLRQGERRVALGF